MSVNLVTVILVNLVIMINDLSPTRFLAIA